MPLLQVEDLRVSAASSRGPREILRGVSFDVQPGEVVGIVGESGSGKSTTCTAILRILRPPLQLTGGRVLFDGREFTTMDDRALRALRGREIAMVLSNGRAALNPLLRIGDQIANVYRAHNRTSAGEARRRAVAMMRAVEIPDAERRAHAYPHELSGGMAQRVLIAMALINRPRLIIADEPTNGLDLTVQLQILNLIRDLIRELQSSAIVVTHDLGVVAHYCQRVNVMLNGQIVESAGVMDLFVRPRHAYTQKLLGSLDRPEREPAPGDVVVS
jgi:ABC-type dipeptide/oligopeptide/nickel transport system ATPase component